MAVAIEKAVFNLECVYPEPPARAMETKAKETAAKLADIVAKLSVPTRLFLVFLPSHLSI